MTDELIEKLESYLTAVDKRYPFDKASLKGFLDWLKREKAKKNK